MKEQMINYLQEMMDAYMEDVKEFGRSDYSRKLMERMIACKEMVEALIGEPVNLRKDGKVTIGF